MIATLLAVSAVLDLVSAVGVGCLLLVAARR